MNVGKAQTSDGGNKPQAMGQATARQPDQGFTLRDLKASLRESEFNIGLAKDRNEFSELLLSGEPKIKFSC